MNIDDLLTKKQQSMARQAVTDWIDAETNSAIRREAYDRAAKWVKSHSAEIESLVDEEMRKQLPKMIREAVKSAANNFYSY